jgi:hypothetical protein
MVMLVAEAPALEGVPAAVPTYGVIVYPVIAAPPLAGAVHVTVACESPPVAVTLPGACGTVAGVTAFDVAGALVPNEFEAVTWKVYVTPLLSPTTVFVVVLPSVVTGVPAVVPMYGVTV